MLTAFRLADRLPDEQKAHATMIIIGALLGKEIVQVESLEKKT